MDNKTKAAHLIMDFLPIVGQDPYTGITTAKECAKKAVDIMMPIIQEYEHELKTPADKSYAAELKKIQNFIDTF